MSKYTDGPWEVDPDDRPGMDYNNHVISAKTTERICFMAHGGPSRQDEYDANAQLIAAAPGLLCELEDAVAFMKERMAQDGDHGVSILIRHAEAAIKLATGE